MKPGPALQQGGLGACGVLPGQGLLLPLGSVQKNTPKIRQEGERRRKQEKEKLLLQRAIASDFYRTLCKHETTKK